MGLNGDVPQTFYKSNLELFKETLQQTCYRYGFGDVAWSAMRYFSFSFSRCR
jgi:hypothetical protein